MPAVSLASGPLPAAGVASALSRPAGSAHGRAFVARLTRGDGAVMEPEKGA